MVNCVRGVVGKTLMTRALTVGHTCLEVSVDGASMEGATTYEI